MVFFRLQRCSGTRPISPSASLLRRALHLVPPSAALLFVLLAPVAPAGAEGKPLALVEINRLLTNGGYIVTANGVPLFNHHPEQLLVPASTWKIATALMALETLGPDFRFETRFYLDRDSHLYIKGYGDPYLISEEAAGIIAALGRRLSRINDIVLDDSAFQLTGRADGSDGSRRAYDAANGALGVNFNTINLMVSAAGRITSAEPQTPTLPLMRELGRGLSPGRHRVNIGSNPHVFRHTGELFRAFQEQAGIPGGGRIRQGQIPPGLEPVYIHQATRPLTEIIRGLLLYSNNFVANQIFLTCGARKSGYPATWDQARTAMEEFLTLKTGLPPHVVQVEEGSGLSRRNLITPEGLLAILTAFKPHAHLLPRDKGRLVKSGTLTGVYSYAGYFEGLEGLDGFVLITNQEKNHRDRLLDLMENLYREPGQLIIHAQAE